MKKRFIKKISSKALAVAVGAAVAFQAYGPTIASADDETLYISEVYLSYGKDDASAKKWLTDNGYTVLDQNLNESADGLGSTKRSVYLGYKTTTDSKQAITDMRALNMNGEYSYEEYEKLLENKKTEINSFVADMKVALAEYLENYKSGVLKAKITHDKLNRLLDDDCEAAGLGDLLLQPVKEEMTEEEYNKEPSKHVDMTTLIMQGNIDYVNNLMTDLCYAADTAKDNWVSRLEKSKGFDGIMDKYESQYASLAESKLEALLRSDYDEQAKVLVEKIEHLRESLKAYTECEVKADSGEEKVKAYFNEHPEKSEEAWTLAGTEYLIMSGVKFDETTLLEIVTSDKYDFDKAEDRLVLYPILDAMSQGQRALLSYVDLGQLVITGNLDDKGWE